MVLKKFVKIIGCIALAMSVLVNIVILCVVCPRCVYPDKLGFDYIGVIVGIFALLVTLLVGWQIYNYIFQKQAVHNIVVEEMAEVSDEIVKRNNSMMFLNLGQLGLALFNLGDIRGSTQAYFNALNFWDDFMMIDNNLTRGFNMIVEHLEMIEKDLQDNGSFKFYYDELSSKHFLQTALKIDNQNIINLAMRFVKDN